LGPNGAGKSTSLLTLAGALPALGGAVWWQGRPTVAPLHRRARAGLALVPETRSVFLELTTAENLRCGRVDIERALAVFPELRARLGVVAGLLSGGEQQMLTLARALARSPQVLLVDELSLGLAPQIVARLMGALRRAADVEGVGILLVEQQIGRALAVADRAYVMRRGRVDIQGEAEQLRQRVADLEATYLSGEHDGRSRPPVALDRSPAPRRAPDAGGRVSGRRPRRS